MQISQQLVQNFKKTYRKSETADCLWKLETRQMLSQVNASQNSRQTIGNTQNSFQPLVSIIT